MLKNYCYIYDLRSSNLCNCKVSIKKSLNLGIEILDLGIFEMEVENNIAMFEISSLELVLLEHFVKKC